jgi:hypothetical protein
VTKKSGSKLTATLALCRAVLPLLPCLDKHLWPHSPKTTVIFEAFTATYQKISCCMIFQSTTTMKNEKNLMFGEGFIFFISGLHFGIKHYINFRNLTKFVSQHLIATQFFLWPVLSYYVVATATWQHWCRGTDG